jgi:hypothetical protein
MELWRICAISVLPLIARRSAALSEGEISDRDAITAEIIPRGLLRFPGFPLRAKPP